MTEYREFQGKSLDDAIEEACSYYGVEREKLEIEIVNDAKTGIFGLVSMKKACVRAAKAAPATSALLEETLHPETGKAAKGRGRAKSAEAAPLAQAAPETDEKPAKPTRAAKTEKTDKQEKADKADKSEKPARGRKSAKAEPPARGKADSGVAERGVAAPARADAQPRTEEEDEFALPGDANGNVIPAVAQAAPRPERKPRRQETPQRKREKPEEDPTGDALPDLDLLSLDQALVASVTEETVKQLVGPIVGEVPYTISVSADRIRVQVDCGDDSGILVGREGQTLSAVQYIAGRIIGNRLGGAVRLNIDTGNYRERQNDRLNELALSLAEKVKASGRTQSTRPLSAFQRRIIHLALEGDDTVQTSSKGEGSQRRVLIHLKKGKNSLEDFAHDDVAPEDMASEDFALEDSPQENFAPKERSPRVQKTPAPAFEPASMRAPRNLDEPRPANAPPVPKYVPPPPPKPARQPRNLDEPRKADQAETPVE